MKRALAVLVLLLLALAAGGIFLLRRGHSALEQPSRAEEAIARRLRHLATPAWARAQVNPLPAGAAVLADARAHFADHCATCHANDGSGQTPIGKNVYPNAPDLRLADTQSMSDGEIFWVIHNGIRFTAMPAWGENDLDNDVGSWKLVHFIRHLPQLTQEELNRMKTFNPKSPAAAQSDGGHHH